MATVTGVHQVVFALREHGQDMERGVQSELATVAGMVGRTMQRLTPKSRSTLWKSIDVKKVDADTYDIRPTVNYGEFVEDGVKPGGKGLPRFFDPASGSIVDWLRRTAFKGRHKGGMGTRALQSQETELRDRYEGLAWHVRHFGVKAQPFVKPTADEMEPVVLKRLDLAVRRVLGARGGSGSGAVTA
ncbi:MAG: HK97 gp10 family phage protein [Hyphomicrobium sp.]|jgi:hypothetical protein